MEFRLEPKVTAKDMWKLSMRHIYKSMVGVCNVIFAVAIVLLTAKFWNNVEPFLKGLLVFLCILFPIMQPLSVYMRAAKQVQALPQDMVLEIDETGLHITGDNQKSHMPWSRVRGLIKEKGMLILAVDGGRGYMLTDNILGSRKEALISFVESKIKTKS